LAAGVEMPELTAEARLTDQQREALKLDLAV
jgi:hypothetical protein